MILLLKTIPPDRVRELLADDGWCMQQKYDGVRLQVRRQAGKLEAFNRNGEPTELPAELGKAFSTKAGDYWLDGELAWDRYYPFDELTDPAAPYDRRLTRCAELVKVFGDERIRRVRAWKTAGPKAAAFKRAQNQGIEGLVFRRLDAPAVAGENPDVGVRFKFKHRVDVVITGMVPGRASFHCGLFNGGADPVDAGRCPLPGPKKPALVRRAVERIGPGKVVAEVEYLYATDRQQLYQPVFIRLRTDKKPGACTLDQLRGTCAGEIGAEPFSTAETRAAEAEAQKVAKETAKAAKKAKNAKKKHGVPWGLVVLYAVCGIVLLLCGCSKFLRMLSAPRRFQAPEET